ncbi:MAG: phosphoribosylaminoimidazolesuccinocarboxamide synthase [Planctomycetes bacterium]|nr:phosphoribosylaminoimidazolesuccinocarboxamide synthase [Planctomycetota bacterium]
MVLCEGKTKRILSTDNENEVLIVTKDDLTGGDAAKKETISGISLHKTTQTINVFNLLKKEGIETAYISRESDNSFLCSSCDMLPLELVMRRFAWGSYLKREPDLKSTAEAPYRFDEIKTEIFHKHAVVVPPLAESATQMEEGAARDLYLKDGKWADGVYTDPLVQINGDKWDLFSAKSPVDAGNPLFSIDAVISNEEVQSLINDIMIPTFEAIEKAWAGVETTGGSVALVDIKIEVGRRKSDGKIVVADVIDNDSWRIWPGADPRKQLDKQCFRDDNPMSEVAEKYEMVAKLSEQF